jgi:hypothetical protein
MLTFWLLLQGGLIKIMLVAVNVVLLHQQIIFFIFEQNLFFQRIPSATDHPPPLRSQAGDLNSCWRWR